MIDLTRAKDIFAQHKIDLSDEQLGQLDRYAELLVEWNQKMNLTTITDPQGILIKHFLDSILPFTLIPLAQNASLIDVGTGAGFPAIPLLIWRPDLQITLLDSLKKRLSFLEVVLSECALTAKTIHSRAEDGGRQPALREQFDLATARAVANLRELSEYCLPYVRPDRKNIANFDKISPKRCKNGKIPVGIMSNPAGILGIPAFFAIFFSGILCIIVLWWS